MERFYECVGIVFTDYLCYVGWLHLYFSFQISDTALSEEDERKKARVGGSIFKQFSVFILQLNNKWEHFS